MKRFLSALLLAALLLTATGCEFSSSSKFMCVEKSNSTSWSMSYSRFTGTERKTIRIAEPGTVVTVTVETQAGTLDIKVTAADNRDELVYDAQDLQTGVYTFVVAGAGKYNVTVQANDHKGSYALNWSN